MKSIQSFVSRCNKPLIAIKRSDNDFSILSLSPEVLSLDLDFSNAILKSGSFSIFCQDIFETNKNVETIRDCKRLERAIFYLDRQLYLKGFLWDWDVLVIEIEALGDTDDSRTMSSEQFTYMTRIKEQEHKVMQLEAEMRLIRGLLDDAHDRFSSLEMSVKEHDYMLKKLEKSIENIEKNDLLTFTQNFGSMKRFAIGLGIIAMIVSPHLSNIHEPTLSAKEIVELMK